MFKKIITASLLACAVVLTAAVARAQDASQNLTVDVQVKNLSRTESLQDSTTSAPGDRIQVQVTVTARNTAQTSVIVRNVLPSRLAFASGDAGIVNAGGMVIGTMNAGTNRIFSFEAIVTEIAQASLINTAYVRSIESAERSDSAFIIVSTTDPQARNLTIRNRVLNLTRGETVFQSATTASPGDRLRFEVTLETLGNASQTGVKLRYFISGKLAAQPATALFFDGMELGNLAANTTRTITFEAIASDQPEGTLNNLARVSSDQVGVKESTAVVFLQKAGSNTGTVTKTVASGTVTAVNRRTGLNATSGTARPSDVIAFALSYRNNSGVLENVRLETDIRDIMTLARVSNTGSAVVDNGLIRFVQVSVTPGGEVTQVFEVTVLDAEQIISAPDRTMVITFGNSLAITVDPSAVSGITTPPPAPVKTIRPPRTGAAEWMTAALAALTTFGYWVYRRKSRLNIA